MLTQWNSQFSKGSMFTQWHSRPKQRRFTNFRTDNFRGGIFTKRTADFSEGVCSLTNPFSLSEWRTFELKRCFSFSDWRAFGLKNLRTDEPSDWHAVPIFVVGPQNRIHTCIVSLIHGIQNCATLNIVLKGDFFLLFYNLQNVTTCLPTYLPKTIFPVEFMHTNCIIDKT